MNPEEEPRNTITTTEKELEDAIAATMETIAVYWGYGTNIHAKNYGNYIVMDCRHSKPDARGNENDCWEFVASSLVSGLRAGLLGDYEAIRELDLEPDAEIDSWFLEMDDKGYMEIGGGTFGDGIPLQCRWVRAMNLQFNIREAEDA